MLNAPAVDVQRSEIRLCADPTRVIARLFLPAGELRVSAILDRVLSLPDADARRIYEDILDRYSSRHRDIAEVFERHYDAVAGQLNGNAPKSELRRSLIGAYFTSEYSLEAAALFNPSIVLHSDQIQVSDGEARFIMSLRACGEGHISSVQFRAGTIDSSSQLTFDPVQPFAASGMLVDDHVHDKNRFFMKLSEIGAYRPWADRILNELPDAFTIAELQRSLLFGKRNCREHDMFKDMADAMLWLVHSSYRLEFPPSSDLSERVIFPVTENESRGIEDARFVRFTYDSGEVVYFATCTAYNGVRALPQFIQTQDFAQFKIHPLYGKCAQNKGMALFPRKIADRYVMISRLDGENLYVLRSDDIHFWHEAQKIHGPTHPWEYVQVGNCGSPIETDEGWLLLTHGVGPMREYWMGAMLLDLEDPSRVRGHLVNPVLTPNADERDGYVPNVVYSCGAIAHGDRLIIPYGISDTSTGVATMSVAELLDGLKRG